MYFFLLIHNLVIHSQEKFSGNFFQNFLNLKGKLNKYFPKKHLFWRVIYGDADVELYPIAKIDFPLHHLLPAVQNDFLNSWSTWYSARSQSKKN